MTKREHPEEPVRRFALRVVLLLLGVVILLLTVLSLFPTDRIGENDTVTVHPTAESLLFVNMVLFCVHLLIAAAAEGSNLASGVGADRGPAPVVTLVAAHLVVDVCCKLTCFVHCVAIASIGPLIIVSMCVVGSALMYPALNDLREAMRSHHARLSGERNVTHLATEAITRGIAVLGLQAYMLTESLACFGGDGSQQHLRRECGYTMFNLFALAAMPTHLCSRWSSSTRGWRRGTSRCAALETPPPRENQRRGGRVDLRADVRALGLQAQRAAQQGKRPGEMVGISLQLAPGGRAAHLPHVLRVADAMFRVRRLVAEREERGRGRRRGGVVRDPNGARGRRRAERTRGRTRPKPRCPRQNAKDGGRDGEWRWRRSPPAGSWGDPWGDDEAFRIRSRHVYFMIDYLLVELGASG